MSRVRRWTWFVVFTGCAPCGDSQAPAFFLMSCAHAGGKDPRMCVQEDSVDLTCTYSRLARITLDRIRSRHESCSGTVAIELICRHFATLEVWIGTDAVNRVSSCCNIESSSGGSFEFVGASQRSWSPLLCVPLQRQVCICGTRGICL